MAMTTGRRGTQIASINMTPMIDVLLVLLIIFMVVQQGLQRGVPVHVPPPAQDQPSGDPPDQIVLEVAPGGSYLLNRRPVSAGALESTLASVFAPRPRKVLFVKGHEQVAYADVVRAVDISRSAGVEVRRPRAPRRASITAVSHRGHGGDGKGTEENKGPFRSSCRSPPCLCVRPAVPRRHSGTCRSGGGFFQAV